MGQIPYSAMPGSELSEDAVCREVFASRDDIDIRFFGRPAPYQRGMEIDYEDFCKRHAADQVHGAASQSFMRWFGRDQKFNRRQFRKGFEATFGTIGLLWFLYYLAVAIYYWRQMRSQPGSPA